MDSSESVWAFLLFNLKEGSTMAEGDNPQGGADPTQAFQSRLAKMNGDAMAFATQLFDENFQHRTKIRELEGKVPSENSVVLKKSEAEQWEAFKALGKKPEEIKQALTDAETVTTERDDLKKKDILRDVAGAHGYKLTVLQDRDKESGGLEYKLKDEKDSKGETRKVAYVVVEGKETPLEEYAQQNWADYLPSLKEAEAQTPLKMGNGRDPKPVGAVTPDAVAAEKKRILARSGYGL
jgi:hypothetical protein